MSLAQHYRYPPNVQPLEQREKAPPPRTMEQLAGDLRAAVLNVRFYAGEISTRAEDEALAIPPKNSGGEESAILWGIVCHAERVAKTAVDLDFGEVQNVRKSLDDLAMARAMRGLS